MRTHIAFRLPILSYAPFEMSSSKLQPNLFFISFLKVITPPGPSRHTKKEMKKSGTGSFPVCSVTPSLCSLTRLIWKHCLLRRPWHHTFWFTSRCRLSLRRFFPRQTSSGNFRLFSSDCLPFVCFSELSMLAYLKAQFQLRCSRPLLFCEISESSELWLLHYIDRAC